MNKKKMLILVIIFTALIVIVSIVLNRDTRYNNITISESEWNTILSVRNENRNLILEDIEFNDYNLIIDENNSSLYYSLVETSKNKYNPNVKFKTRESNVKIAVLSDEITDEKVKNNYEFKIMIYSDKDYHIYNLKCTYLPILNIRYKEELGNKQKNIPMEIYVFDNLSKIPNKITISDGKLKIFEDRYTFSLNMTTPGKNIRDNRISILNMNPNSEYSLTSINNKEQNIDGKSHQIELFINNEYKGRYLLEHVEQKEKIGK